MTVSVDDPGGPDPRRGPGRSIAVAVVALLVAAVLVRTLGPDGSPASRPAPTTGVAGTVASAVPASMRPGLRQGTASADLRLATRSVSGVRRGFPATVDGAVEAYSAALGTFVMGIAAMSTAEVRRFVSDFTHSSIDYTPLVAQKRAVLGMGADGTVVGAPADARLLSSCPPALGAYKATRTSASDVQVTYWGPCVYGTGSPTDRSRLEVLWQWSTVTMRWADGDWRLPATARPALGRAPRPDDLDRPDTSFSVRAKLLGPGWSLFEGASQSWPTSLLGTAP